MVIGETSLGPGGEIDPCWISNISDRTLMICPKCQGIMRIIRFIEDRQIIRAILDHLGIWLVRARPPSKILDPPIREYAAVDLHLQTHADDFYSDPYYFWDADIHA
jgi:hypothetical protein